MCTFFDKAIRWKLVKHTLLQSYVYICCLAAFSEGERLPHLFPAVSCLLLPFFPSNNPAIIKNSISVTSLTRELCLFFCHGVKGTTSWPCLFCWKNSCSFSGNSVRTFQSFVSLCWIRYCLASWVLCSQDGWRITVMSSLLPVTSITYWWSLWPLNVINRQNSFMIAQWGMEVRSSSSSNWFIEHKHLSDWSVLIFNWIICYSFQLNSNAQLSFPQRMSVGGLMKGDRLSLVSYRAVRLHQSFPGKPYSRLFHRYSWISAFHTYLFPALLTHWNRAKLI